MENNDNIAIRKKLEEKKKKEQKDRIFSGITITYEAFDKMYQYSSLLHSITGVDLECMGYLVAPADKDDGIVYDLVYSFDQEVSESEGSNFIGNKRTIDEIHLNELKILGFWHSHGIYKVTPSETDNQIAKFLATQEAKYLEHEMGQLDFDFEEIKDQKIITILSPNNSYNKIQVTYRSNSLEKPIVTHIAIDKIKYWYTIIINNRQNRPYHASIHHKEWDAKKRGYKSHKSEIVELNFIESNQKLNLSTIIDEVFERTIYRKTKLADVEKFRQNYIDLKSSLGIETKEETKNLEDSIKKIKMKNSTNREEPKSEKSIAASEKKKYIMLEEENKTLQDIISQLNSIDMHNLDQGELQKIMGFKEKLSHEDNVKPKGSYQKMQSNHQLYQQLREKLTQKDSESLSIVDEENKKCVKIYQQIYNLAKKHTKLNLNNMLSLAQYKYILEEMHLRYSLYEKLQNKPIDSRKRILNHICLINDELYKEFILVGGFIEKPKKLIKQLFGIFNSPDKKLIVSYLDELGFDEQRISNVLKVIQ